MSVLPPPYCKIAEPAKADDNIYLDGTVEGTFGFGLLISKVPFLHPAITNRKKGIPMKNNNFIRLYIIILFRIFQLVYSVIVKVAVNILVGGDSFSVVTPTPLPVVSLNSGSVHKLVFGLNMSRFLPDIVIIAF